MTHKIIKFRNFPSLKSVTCCDVLPHQNGIKTCSNILSKSVTCCDEQANNVKATPIPDKTVRDLVLTIGCDDPGTKVTRYGGTDFYEFF